MLLQQVYLFIIGVLLQALLTTTFRGGKHMDMIFEGFPLGKEDLGVELEDERVGQ